MPRGIQNRPTNRFPWASPTGGVVSNVGLTADEVKLNQGLALKEVPEHLPIATRAPVEMLSPSSSAEHVRLAVPLSENPYATPTGPKHDYMMVRTVLSRSSSKASRDLMRSMKKPPAGLAEKSVKQMKASLAREHAMHVLLQNLQEMQEMIYGNIIGSQAG